MILGVERNVNARKGPINAGDDPKRDLKPIMVLILANFSTINRIFLFAH